MDDKTQALYDAKTKQIDVELQQELIKIDEEYSRRGIPNSGMHLRARGLAEIKANAKKDELKAKLSINNTKILESKKEIGVVYIYSNGKIVYVSKTQKKYEAKFRKGDNSILLLQFLATNPRFLYSSEELGKILNKPRQKGEDSTSERRVRDTLKTIRKKLGIIKKDENIFIVENGFGLNCNATFVG